jgi:nitrite reductase (NADH) small subunit/3-phenylpropionate/trans-cinnamate dioxygenase ferredoxin subunit
MAQVAIEWRGRGALRTEPLFFYPFLSVKIRVIRGSSCLDCGRSPRWELFFGSRSRMAEFQTVARVGEIPAGEGRAYRVGSRMVAVFFVDGAYTAINDTCPHMGASLSTGYVEEGGVICPWHAWKFCVKEGTWLDNPRACIKQETYEVRLVGDEIQVSVPEPKAAAPK